jgi:hypothetical protein
MKKSALQHRKIGGTADYILPLGILGLGVLVLYKMGVLGGTGGPGGSGGTGGNNTSLANANTAATTATAAQAAAAGQQPVLSPITLQGIASNVYSLGIADTPDLNQVENLLMQPDNTADLNAVIQYFGTKNVNSSSFNWCAVLDMDCTAVDLAAFVRAIFSNQPGMLQSINS